MIHRPVIRHAGAILAAGIFGLLLPLAVAAHPLGNFTINHYAGLRIAPDSISLDIVIDQAEIPTFQERQRIDSDGDGQVSDAELAAERSVACTRLARLLDLTVGGATLGLTSTAVGLSFPPGAGGLPTMRLVCEYEAISATRMTATTTVHFEDRSNVERIGWREIVAQGDGVTLVSEYPAVTASARLTAYPQSLLATPLNIRTVDIEVRPGGAALAAWTAPDATPLDAQAVVSGSEAAGTETSSGSGAAPGGVASEISGLLGTNNSTPLVLVLSLMAAAALGAGHALTPGHGKTIMAAYLVGTRGRARHALGLGLATAVSHTLGVLALAGLILVAGTALPADRVYPILTAVSGLIVIAIGAWLLAGQVTRWSSDRAMSAGRGEAMLPTTGLTAAMALAHDHTDHDHPHRHTSPATQGTDAVAVAAPGMHRHGWRVHSHTPARPTSLSWRSLFALGLSGGLVPSTNALIILVATVAAGKPEYGVVLVLAFGLGMAAVLVGVGLAMVYAAGWIGRASTGHTVGRLLTVAPALAAVAVVVLGLYLTQQALRGTPVL